jgi:thiol-disulfide isomerase/thioredoxin
MMKFTRHLILAILLSVSLRSAVLGDPGLAFPGKWLVGAAGFDTAMKAHKASGRPVLVYVYTDWCPYCRKFNTQVLPDERVQACIAKFAAVALNPDSGADELATAEKLRITGYPTVLALTDDAPFFQNVATQVPAPAFASRCNELLAESAATRK